MAAIALVAPAAGTAPTIGKPVIGKPVTVPARPVAGKRFAVSFKVTRRDTGAPVTRGRMICDPSVAGQTIRHAESFKRGIARLAFVVPTSAAGNVLKVKVTIKTGTQSATRVAAFRVQATPTPSISIGDSSAPEGDAGTTTLSFPVTLSSAAGQTVSVGYATADQTAVAPSDYAAANGTVAFKPGETVKTIPISVVGDLAIERDESFTVTISSPGNATIANATATGTIATDDEVTSGQYAGRTASGKQTVYFWVSPKQTLTAFRVVGLPCPCGGGPVRVWAGQELRESTFPITADGSFAGEASWNGSRWQGDFEWTHWDMKVTGVFATTTSASGTYIANYELNYKGTHYRCSSGEVRWSAAFPG